MHTYKKILIIISALLILPTLAQADDATGLDELEVTMVVVESPEDSPEKITNRLEIPTEEYLQARERNRLQYRYRNSDTDEQTADGTQDMSRFQAQTREMIQEQQRSAIKNDIEDNIGQQGGANGGGHGNGQHP